LESGKHDHHAQAVNLAAHRSQRFPIDDARKKKRQDQPMAACLSE
jgi:hypothetical protein